MSITYLTKSLYDIFKALFWFTILGLVFKISATSLKTQKKTDFSPGYSIPVKMKLVIHDSIIQYHEDGIQKTTYFKKNDSKKNLYINEVNSISKNNIIIKPFNPFKKEIESSLFELSDSDIKSDCSIQVKSSSIWMTVLLCLNDYSSLILAIIMLYFLKEIFKTLNLNFIFHKELSKKVSALGLVFTFGSLFKLLTSMAFYYCYDIITISSSIDNISILNPTNILIYPRLNFKLGLFIIGISIITLGKLLNEGNRLQQENELTI